MSYVKISTLEKVEANDIMLAHPEVSFPNRGWNDEDILPFGYAELHWPLDHPFVSTYEKLVETTPKKIDDKWYIQFEVVPLDEDEIKAKKQYLISNLVEATQRRLDNFAKIKNYDSILSLCTYATSSNEIFKKEGQYGVEMRDATWLKLYEILGEVEAGIRELPTDFAQIENELPILSWVE